ncbi:acetylglutamate kinase [Candidatus Pelagibacter sp.]|nr:acetylglutamate kinase [Candidatus Pelagibacter sp.]
MSKIIGEEIQKILPEKGPSFEEVKKYLDKYNKEYIVIKCGGSVLVDPKLFKIFIEDVTVLKKLGFNPVVIHGGGKRINNKLGELSIKSDFINGLRVTDKNTINIVEDVLIEFNKEIVNALKDQSCESRGITSKEYNIINVKPESDKLGFVGSPTHIKTNVLKEIIKVNEVPVVAPLGLDENNQTFNINADTAAGAIAKKLKARRLIIMSDIEGVLDNDNKLISEINTDKVNELIKNETIFGGMIPKIKNCLDVANNGVKGVVIIDGRKSHSILFELLSDKGAGTLFRK